MCNRTKWNEMKWNEEKWNERCKMKLKEWSIWKWKECIDETKENKRQRKKVKTKVKQMCEWSRMKWNKDSKIWKVQSEMKGK